MIPRSLSASTGAGMGARKRSIRRAALVGLLALASAIAALPADAAISISPTSIKVSDAVRTQVVRLTNSGSAAVDMQIRAMSWTHDAGGDRLGPTTDVAVSPPFVRIEAGGTQTIRVGLNGAASDPSYYRLLISEIAAPSQAGSVNFALAISVPIIAGGQFVREPQLGWTASASPAGLDLVATDMSPWHATIADLHVVDGNGRRVAPEVVGTSGVVLPGRERRWILGGLGSASGPLVLTGTMNGTVFTTNVDVGAP